MQQATLSFIHLYTLFITSRHPYTLLCFVMSAFGGDSPLSDAPSSNFSPFRKSATPIAVEPEVPAAKVQPKNKKGKPKPPTKAQPATDLFPSRRSSRISDRSTSPEKAASPRPAGEGEGEGSSKPVIATNLKIKLRYTSPGREKEKEKEKTVLNDEAVVERPEPELEAEEVSATTAKARGKKRKSEVGHGVEEEVRREMGKKKSKVSHQSQSQDQEAEPQKSTSKSKNIAIKRKSVAGGKSTNDIIADFLDEEEAGQKEEIVAKPQEEPKMRSDTHTKKSKKRRNTTTTTDVDVDANADSDVVMDEAAIEPEVSVEKADTDQTQTDGIAPPAKPTMNPKLKLKSKGGKPTQKSRKSEETDPSPARADPTPPTQMDSAHRGEESSVDPDTKADPTTSHVEKPKKSFAQVVASSEKAAAAGAGTASPREPKKEKRPLPSIPKFAKQSTNANTPLKAGTAGPGTSTPGTGPSTGTKKAPLPTTASSTPGIPAQRKVTQAPSLLEQTMANLLGGNVAATTAKGTPKAKKDVSPPLS
jgi:hypothetical protein